MAAHEEIPHNSGRIGSDRSIRIAECRLLVPGRFDTASVPSAGKAKGAVCGAWSLPLTSAIACRPMETTDCHEVSCSVCRRVCCA